MGLQHGLQEAYGHELTLSRGNSLVSDDEVLAIEKCIGEPIVNHLIDCVKKGDAVDTLEEATAAVHACVSPEQLQRIQHCVEHEELVRLQEDLQILEDLTTEQQLLFGEHVHRHPELHRHSSKSDADRHHEEVSPLFEDTIPDRMSKTNVASTAPPGQATSTHLPATQSTDDAVSDAASGISPAVAGDLTEGGVPNNTMAGAVSNTTVGTVPVDEKSSNVGAVNTTNGTSDSMGVSDGSLTAINDSQNGTAGPANSTLSGTDSIAGAVSSAGSPASSAANTVNSTAIPTSGIVSANDEGVNDKSDTPSAADKNGIPSATDKNDTPSATDKTNSTIVPEDSTVATNGTEVAHNVLQDLGSTANATTPLASTETSASPPSPGDRSTPASGGLSNSTVVSGDMHNDPLSKSPSLTEGDGAREEAPKTAASANSDLSSGASSTGPAQASPDASAATSSNSTAAPLIRRKYGYGPDWESATGHRDAHPLPRSM